MVINYARQIKLETLHMMRTSVTIRILKKGKFMGREEYEVLVQILTRLVIQQQVKEEIEGENADE